jgi:hypothetical protein
MPTTPQPTQAEIELNELPVLEGVNDVLASEPVASAVETLSEAMFLLSGERRQQLSNILSVLNHGPVFLRAEVDRIQAENTPPAPPEEPVEEVTPATEPDPEALPE